MSDWQPIETAPKDGTPIYGFMPSYYRGKGGQSVIMWLAGHWMDNRAFETSPSHWQPLSEPPVTPFTTQETKGHD